MTDYPLQVNPTAASTAHLPSWRYRMALQPLSQIVTWANRLLDRFLSFPMLTDCCGQSVGAALNLKESNQGMIYSLLLAVKKTLRGIKQNHQATEKRSGSCLHSTERNWNSLPWDVVEAKIKNGLKTSQHTSESNVHWRLSNTKMRTEPLAPETKLFAAKIREAVLWKASLDACPAVVFFP